MNQSKSAIKKPKQKKKSEAKSSSPKVLFISFIVVLLVMIGIMSFEQFRTKELLIINKDKYDLEDLMYYFYTTEAEHSYYNDLYQSMGMGNYWDMDYDETSGSTMRDVAKSQVIDTATRTEILYQEAKNADYTLTPEEIDTIAADVNTLLTETLTKKQVKDIGFTEKYLKKYIGKETLAMRYRQDIIDAFDIDDAAITATFAFEDYKQYDIETLFVSTQETDAEGNAVDLSADKKTAAYDKLNAIYDEAVKSADWSTLLAEDEKELTFNANNFIETDTTYADEFEAMIMGMSNKDVSEIYEAEDGYYIVKMINNASTESYDKEVSTAITKAETEKFDAFYTDVLTNYTVKTKKSALQSITMGEVTIKQ